MDEAQKKMMFILRFMMLFQLVDHIYNSHVQDMNSIMNASIAMETAKKKKLLLHDMKII
jgi:hypothetical protein